PAPGQEVLDEEEPAFSGASDDAEESLHAGHLFEPLADEPLEEVAREVILVTDREIYEIVDLPGHGELPLQGELHRFLGRLEVGLGARDRGNTDAAARVDEEVDEAHRVGALFHRLFVEVRGQSRQVLAAEVGSDGYVLQEGPEFVSNLGVDGCGHALADQHSLSLRCRFSATASGAGPLATRSP